MEEQSKMKQLERNIKIKQLELDRDLQELEELQQKEKQLRQELDRKQNLYLEKKSQNELQEECKALLDDIYLLKKAETEKVAQDRSRTMLSIFEQRVKFSEDVSAFVKNYRTAIVDRSKEVSSRRQEIKQRKDDLETPRGEYNQLEKELERLKEHQSLVRQLKNERKALSNPDNDPEIKIAYRLIEERRNALDEQENEEMADYAQEETVDHPSNHDIDSNGESLITEPRMYSGNSVRPRLMYSTSNNYHK